MCPLLTIAVSPNDDIRRFSTFNPRDQTQDDVVICLIDRGARGDSTHHALSHQPRTGSAQTMTHAGDHKEAVKVIQTTFPY